MTEPLRPGLERFPRRIETLDELPDPVREALLRAEDPARIGLVVIMPPQEYAIARKSWLRYLPFGWRVTPPRWLVFGVCQITIVEAAPDGTCTATVIPLADLLDIQLVSVLLYAYVEFAWMQDGGTQRLRIEFNLVGEHAVRQGLNQIRSALYVARAPETPPDQRTLIGALPLKFRNFLRISLLPSEVVLEAAFQPAIRHPQSRLRRYLAPNRAIALTDHCLIVIDEGSSPDRRDYKMVRRFYPLLHLQSALVEDGAEPAWLRLWFGVQDCGEQLALPLEPAALAILQDALRPWLLPQFPRVAIAPEPF